MKKYFDKSFENRAMAHLIMKQLPKILDAKEIQELKDSITVNDIWFSSTFGLEIDFAINGKDQPIIELSVEDGLKLLDDAGVIVLKDGYVIEITGDGQYTRTFWKDYMESYTVTNEDAKDCIVLYIQTLRA